MDRLYCWFFGLWLFLSVGLWAQRRGNTGHPEKMRRLNKQIELEKLAYTKINFHGLGSEVLQGATEAARIIVQGESWEKEKQAGAVVRIREVSSELKGLAEWLKSDWVKEDDDENGERYIFQDGKLIRSDDGNITFGK